MPLTTCHQILVKVLVSLIIIVIWNFPFVFDVSDTFVRIYIGITFIPLIVIFLLLFRKEFVMFYKYVRRNSRERILQKENPYFLLNGFLKVHYCDKEYVFDWYYRTNFGFYITNQGNRYIRKNSLDSNSSGVTKGITMTFIKPNTNHRNIVSPNLYLGEKTGCEHVPSQYIPWNNTLYSFPTVPSTDESYEEFQKGNILVLENNVFRWIPKGMNLV